MTINLKISDSQLQSLMLDLVMDDTNIINSFARAVWSLITEPGDTFAAALISSLGPKVALEAEVNRLSAKKYADLLRSAGFEDKAGDRFKNLDSLLVDARER